MRSEMIKSFLWTAVFCLLLTLAAGCSNPAADAPEAVVEEPAATTESSSEPMGEVVTYTLAEGSTIGFVGSKITGSHDGGFELFEGQMDVTDGNAENVQIGVTIDTTSLWADDERLTGHLKSPDFFDVENHPTASFSSTAVAANEDGSYSVTGNLDLHGVTKQISFPATIELGEGEMTAMAEFSIKRFDFNIVYPGKPDDLIRDDVLIKLNLKATAGDAAEGEMGEGSDGHGESVS